MKGEFTVGEFEFSVSLDGWPRWVRIRHHGKEISGFEVRDIPDLVYGTEKIVALVAEKDREIAGEWR
jgi:hypothetical protein